MLLDAFATHCHRFLQHHAVEGHGFVHIYHQFVVKFHIGAIVTVEQTFQALDIALEQIAAVGLGDAFSHLGKHRHIFVGETALAVGRDVEQKRGIAAHRALVDVEHIVG